MTDASALISMIPVGGIAEKLGVNRSIAEAAVAVAVPALVGGLAANATAAPSPAPTSGGNALSGLLGGGRK